jgi:hypothetical protein
MLVAVPLCDTPLVIAMVCKNWVSSMLRVRSDELRSSTALPEWRELQLIFSELVKLSSTNAPVKLELSGVDGPRIGPKQWHEKNVAPLVCGVAVNQSTWMKNTGCMEFSRRSTSILSLVAAALSTPLITYY